MKREEVSLSLPSLWVKLVALENLWALSLPLWNVCIIFIKAKYAAQDCFLKELGDISLKCNHQGAGCSQLPVSWDERRITSAGLWLQRAKPNLLVVKVGSIYFFISIQLANTGEPQLQNALSMNCMWQMVPSSSLTWRQVIVYPENMCITAMAICLAI